MAKASIGMVALCVTLLAVTGCGFKLRSYGFTGAIESYALIGRTNLQVAEALRRQLRQAGVAEASPAEASVVLELLDERRDRRSASTAGGARAAEYEMTLEVHYRVLDASGAELVAPTWIERQRVYRIDRDNIVGSSGEQTILEQELINDIAGQMTRVLDTVGRRVQTDAANAG
jgi:LPS-assembly lipoprotein